MTAEEDKIADKGERIAKVMARAGLCSRREAERWIAEHRVAVDGEVLSSPAFLVTSANRITVDGVGIPQNEPVRMWRVNKPLGLLTTHRDPEGRPILFEQLPKNTPSKPFFSAVVPRNTTCPLPRAAMPWPIIDMKFVRSTSMRPLTNKFKPPRAR